MYAIGKVLYNLFFHPLRKYPGPWYAAASPLWIAYHHVRGDHPHHVRDMHNRYGPVVRLAPDELSYTDARAFHDIYGHHNSVPENPKHPSQNFTRDPANPTILDAPREAHSQLRRPLSNAFSGKVMKEQEPVLLHYVDLLVKQLATKDASTTDESSDMVEWFNVRYMDRLCSIT